MQTTFKVGDRVRVKENVLPHLLQRFLGQVMVLTKVTDVPAASISGVGHPQWVQWKGSDGDVSGMLVELAPSSITLDKTYRTRDGREVRLLMVDSGGSDPVVGAFRNGDEWVPASWNADGAYIGGIENAEDLIEVKPQITKWANIYAYSAALYDTREQADNAASHTRVACKEITYHDGEGL